jgi:hypothetical protein
VEDAGVRAPCRNMRQQFFGKGVFMLPGGLSRVLAHARTDAFASVLAAESRGPSVCVQLAHAPCCCCLRSFALPYRPASARHGLGGGCPACLLSLTQH